MHGARLATTAAVAGALMIWTGGPAAANSYQTSYAGVTSAWNDGLNKLTVSGGDGNDYGQIRRPDGVVVTVSSGSSKSFPNMVEDGSIAIRACDAKSGLPDACGSWVNGYS